MTGVSAGDCIAVRVSDDVVALAIVSTVHEDGAVDGMVYAPDQEPSLFFNIAVQNEESAVVNSAWFPATAVT